MFFSFHFAHSSLGYNQILAQILKGDSSPTHSFTPSTHLGTTKCLLLHVKKLYTLEVYTAPHNLCAMNPKGKAGSSLQNPQQQRPHFLPCSWREETINSLQIPPL